MDRILSFLGDHWLAITVSIGVALVILGAVGAAGVAVPTAGGRSGGRGSWAPSRRRARRSATVGGIGGGRSSGPSPLPEDEPPRKDETEVAKQARIGAAEPKPNKGTQVEPEPKPGWRPQFEPDEERQIRPQSWDADFRRTARGAGWAEPSDLDKWVAREAKLQRPEEEERPQAPPQVPAEPQSPTHTDAENEPARYVNLAFRRAGTGEVMPSEQSLAPNEKYHLRFNIGGLLEDRIPDGREMPPTIFPGKALPPDEAGHWLDVVAAGRDFTVDKGGKFRVFLPNHGSSWVCDCNPKEPHKCTADTRQPFLLIPLTTPPHPGEAELRIGVYFKNNLLQSCRVMLQLSSNVTLTIRQSVITDYTIIGTFTTLQKLGTKKLNILAAKLKGGEQAFIVNGDFDNPIIFHLAEGKLNNAVDAARELLRNIHMREESNIFGRKWLVNNFDSNNAKSKADFIEDLRKAAPVGRLLWTSLFELPDLRQLLRDDVLREPSTIQIARVSTDFVFPWSLVYDIPLESNTAKHKVCKVLDNWGDAKGLSLEGASRCPHANEHSVNILCPFGFWGVRHDVEQPPSVGEAGTLAAEIRVTKPPARLFLCASSDLDSTFTAPHIAAIKKDLTYGIEDFETQDTLFVRLQTVDAGIVYLYCHGGNEPLAGTKSSVPFLRIGAGEKLTPNDVITKLNEPGTDLFWRLANPLIFINGCHTTELTTDILVNFVDAFAAFYSSGVIGTEVTVHQQLANEAGAAFLKYFAKGSAGEALRRMRHDLLCKGNLMGLAYSNYCLSTLRIADTVSLAAASTVATGQ